MSALTEQVAVLLWDDHVGDSGNPPTDSELLTFASAVEQAVRASVAAEIGAYSETITEPWSDHRGHYLGGMYDARDIAEGKQP